MATRRPTRADLDAARDATIPDVLAPGLDVVFVGINPGLWSGAVGHHFARPGNRFWRVLHLSRFTDRVLAPSEDVLLPAYGLGVTNLVARATATAAELSADELRRGADRLVRTLGPLAPRAVAILGIGAYRTAFERPKASIGPQGETLANATLWVLPNPSGLNAHYQVDALSAAFSDLRADVGPPRV